MDTQMHKIGVSCDISIAVERFQFGIVPISGNVSNEKNVNSFILVCCSSMIFMERKVSNNL